MQDVISKRITLLCEPGPGATWPTQHDKYHASDCECHCHEKPVRCPIAEEVQKVINDDAPITNMFEAVAKERFNKGIIEGLSLAGLMVLTMSADMPDKTALILHQAIELQINKIRES